MHPENDLALHALGALPPDERDRVEAHLATCAACRAELRRHQEVVERMVEELPAVPPPERVRASLLRLARDESTTPDAADPPSRPQKRGAGGVPARPVRRFLPGGRGSLSPLARALGVLLTVGVLLAGGLAARAVRTEARIAAEQRTVAAWLSRSDVAHVPLRNRSGASAGGVLLSPDGRALFVLGDPAPTGREFQAWGHVGDDLVSLGTTSRPVFEVDVRGYDALYLSSEPPGGSPEPTEALGWTEL